MGWDNYDPFYLAQYGFKIYLAKSKKKEKEGPTELEDSAAIISYAEKLFKAADKLRKNIDAAEYKHPVLGLIFLKYISDSFEERYQELEGLKAKGADPEEKSEYLAEKVFWVPKEARWSTIQDSAKSPQIGKILDDAMIALERDNDSLKGVLPKDYARPKLDKANLGSLVDLFSNIPIGGKKNRSRDVLGRIYEYFLGKFASKEGKKGGQFYTPTSVVRLLVEMIQPIKGRLYEPCAGSGGMIVQTDRFMENNNGQLAFYGQESNETTWRLCKMNLAIRAIDADIRWNSEGSFTRDEHRNLKADYILANPPFNDDEWAGDKLHEDSRWIYGIPPEGNANYAWVQHFISHLSNDGIAGFVLSIGSLGGTSENDDESLIRSHLIEADLIDCIINLPGKLFFSTSVGASLWFITKNKKNSKFRDRTNQTLFVDARGLGTAIDRSHKELLESDIKKIANTYHAWKNKKSLNGYKDKLGFCKSCSTKDILKRNSLLPGMYVGYESDPEPDFGDVSILYKQIRKLFSDSEKIESEIIKKFDEELNDK